jgi:hypothetical protein
MRRAVAILLLLFMTLISLAAMVGVLEEVGRDSPAPENITVLDGSPDIRR